MAATPTLHFAFDFGQTVYLACRDERMPGKVTGYFVRPGTVAYAVTWGSGAESTHYDFELSREFVPDYAREASPQPEAPRP
jgi:hypothetical protein